MSDDRPIWAQRMAAERSARKWSQRDAIQAMRENAKESLPDDQSLIRQWKRWESGEGAPGEYYRPVIAAAFGMVQHAIFPVAGRRDGESELNTITGLETLEIIGRLRASDIDDATIEGLRLTVDRLCSEYSHLPASQLLLEGRKWLSRVVGLQAQKLTLSQHKEILRLAGWLALLVGCVEYDCGHRRSSEATRLAAQSLGLESQDAEIVAWSHEMQAWAALTNRDFRGVISAAQAGYAAGGVASVSVQLAAQEAKAWSRLGDSDKAVKALDRGHEVLDSLDYPRNLNNHFVIDPSKYDFHAMECYRVLGMNDQAETSAREVISASTFCDGSEKSPMRLAEARITLGIIAARRGELEEALSFGNQALSSVRKSLPSLLMASRDLVDIVRDDFGEEQGVKDYLERLRALSRGQAIR